MVPPAEIRTVTFPLPQHKGRRLCNLFLLFYDRAALCAFSSSAGTALSGGLW